MSDYLRNGNLDEKDMSSAYLAAEQSFREKAARLWEDSEEAKKTARSMVDATAEERQDFYKQRYQRKIAPTFDKLASDFVDEVMRPRGRDERLLTQGVGTGFSDYLISLSDKPLEELPSLMRTAQRTGQRDLVRAIAQVALGRNEFALFEEWAASEPELAGALKRVKSTPDPEQFATRTNALRPPKASPEALEPTDEDRARVASAPAMEEANRAAFYNRPRSISGRTTRVL